MFHALDSRVQSRDVVDHSGEFFENELPRRVGEAFCKASNIVPPPTTYID